MSRVRGINFLKTSYVRLLRPLACLHGMGSPSIASFCSCSFASFLSCCYSIVAACSLGSMDRMGRKGGGGREGGSSNLHFPATSSLPDKHFMPDCLQLLNSLLRADGDVNARIFRSIRRRAYSQHISGELSPPSDYSMSHFRTESQ